MSNRYLTNITLAVAAAFIVVSTQAFAASSLQWFAFGLGVFTILLIAGGSIRARPLAQRALDGAAVIIGAWLIVESFALSGGPLVWWTFGSAVALTGVALIGLTLHELGTERTVHLREIAGDGEAPPQRQAQAQKAA